MPPERVGLLTVGREPRAGAAVAATAAVVVEDFTVSTVLAVRCDGDMPSASAYPLVTHTVRSYTPGLMRIRDS